MSAPPPDESPPDDVGASESEELLGVVLGARWRIDALLAVGGTSHVYEAFDQVRGETVALKAIKSEEARSAGDLGRFVRELTVLMQVDSPHIVRIVGLGSLGDGRPYYAMERLEGRTLADLLDAAGGPLRPERVVLLARQVLLGLEACHAHGLVHRDLKPENVLVDAHDRVTILDFGLAKAPDGSQDVTNPGAALGTPCYMAPEQIRRGVLDPRTDVYAFGVVLYEMLTGRPPFDSPESLDVIMGHLQDAVVRPNAVDPALGLPPILEWIVMSCLAKDPDRRFQSATEVRAEIENAARLYRVFL